MYHARQFAMLAITAVALLVAGCGDSGSSSSSSSSSAASGERVKLVGAGASFPAPLYQQWFKNYNEMHPNVVTEYQSIGSGSGIKQFIAGTTMFGASDAAMKPEEIAQVPGGVTLLPMTAGAVVLAYNVPGVDELKLPRDVYPEIFLGKVTKWNDPKIVAANPGVSLPDAEIKVVHRADGSGTTYVFTKHLSAISEGWKSGPGTGKAVEWPVGVGGKGNEGVTNQIKNTDNSIGYIEYGYSKNAGLNTALLQNKSGNFITCTLESGAKALASAEMPADMIVWVSDPTGAEAYPIVTFTWILAHNAYKPSTGQAFKDVMTYCLTDGQKLSGDAGYLALPEEVTSKVKAALDKIKLDPNAVH